MKQFSIMYRQFGILLCTDNFEVRWKFRRWWPIAHQSRWKINIRNGLCRWHVLTRANFHMRMDIETKIGQKLSPEKPENNFGEPCNPLSNAGLRKIDRFAMCTRLFFLGYISSEIDSCNKYATCNGESGH